MGAPDAAAQPAAGTVALPPLRREYAVQMSCGGCGAAVRRALEGLPGVGGVEVSLAEQSVVVAGDTPPDAVLAALQAAGRAARLVGQGALDVVPPHVGPAAENAAAVAEFKGAAHGHGPLRGVVRVAQLTDAAARADVALSGLPPGRPFCVAVHARGDLRDGAASTGDPWPTPTAALLCAGVADAAGVGACAAPAAPLRVWELIGRSAVIHGGAATPDGSAGSRLAAAVLARSAAVDTNAKRVCACDGTVLWNADAFA